MLGLSTTSAAAISRACRCASTSTSLLLCPHAVPTPPIPIRRHATAAAAHSLRATNPRSTASERQPARPAPPAPQDPALVYPAPLWEKHFRKQQPISSWQSWLARSRTQVAGAAPPPSDNPLPVPPPLSPRSHQLSTSDDKDPEDLARKRVKTYLLARTAKGPPLQRFSSVGADNLLGSAKVLNMRLVSRLVADDIEYRRLGTGRMVDDAEFEPKISSWKAIYGGGPEAALPGTKPTGGGDLSIPTSPAIAAGGAAFPSVNSRLDLLSLFEMSREAPSAPPIERLAALWESFAADYLSPIDIPKRSDVRHALSFLQYLVYPSNNTPDTPPSEYLPLALDVLHTLLATSVSESLLAAAPPPARTDIPHDAKVQTLILRTITSIATDVKDFELAAKGLRHLARLGLAHLVPPELESQAEIDDHEDTRLLVNLLGALNTHLSESVLTTYVRTLSLGLGHPLRLAQRLTLDLLEPGRLEYDGLLDDFAAQCASWSSFELLEPVWIKFGRNNVRRRSSSQVEHRWTLKSHHLELLSSMSNRLPSESYDLARSTLHFFTTTSPRWTLGYRNGLLQHLLDSPSTNLRFRALARRFYLAFLRQHPQPGLELFAVTSKTMLMLVRLSTHHAPVFARQVIRDYLKTIVSPSSPFNRSVNGTLDPVDLTALAEAYVLVDDLQAVSQVFKQMLSQKIVPGEKELEALVAAACQAGTSTEVMRGIRKAGLPVSVRVWKKILLTRKEAGALGWWKGVVELAAPEDQAGLRQFIKALRFGEEPGSPSRLRPRSLNASLAPDSTTMDWKISLKEYMAACRVGLRDEVALYKVLRKVLTVKRRKSPIPWDWMEFLLEHSLDGSEPLVTQRRTAKVFLDVARQFPPPNRYLARLLNVLRPMGLAEPTGD